MRYLVTLKPLEPFMFGGDQTFGALGDKEAGSYLVKSRMFPQQTALLGMLKKEMMTQAGLLTRKLKGEWVDKEKKAKAVELVGNEKFDMLSEKEQNLGVIHNLSPVFLIQNTKRFLKKVNIDAYPYEEGKLKGFTTKQDIYDNFIALDGGTNLTAEDIFHSVEQTGNKKGGEENSLFKKTTYRLEEGFAFAFYVEADTTLHNALVTLGADRSSFMMTVQESSDDLQYVDPKGYLTLLSDTYITLPIKEHCQFAITSELSHRNLKGKKTATKKYDNNFEKSDTLYLYEKGSVFIGVSAALLENMNNKNLQQIGYNIYTTGENK
jgi:CRISPR-associated protein Cmr3